MVETRRRQIENVASTLFRERGYAATSVRDIAGAMNLQGASLYAHVPSKEEVLWSLVGRAASRFEKAAERRAAEANGLGCAERVRAFVRGHVGVITDDPRLATVFVHEWRSLSADRRAEVLLRRDRYEARLRTLIAEGVACRAFGPTDPALAATFILTGLNGIATWYRPDGRLSPDRIADRYAELALRALGGRLEHPMEGTPAP